MKSSTNAYLINVKHYLINEIKCILASVDKPDNSWKCIGKYAETGGGNISAFVKASGRRGKKINNAKVA